MSEQHYSVVTPVGQKPRDDVTLAARPETLDGKRVAEVWDYMFYGDSAFPLLRDELRQRYPDVEIVEYSHFGNIHGPDENEVVAALPDELRRRHIDAVVLGIGN